MRIKLDLEDVRFATTAGTLGTTQWLLVEVGGKKFCVQRTYDFSPWQRERDEEFDKFLVEKMEAVLETIFLHGANSQKEGVEIKTMCPTDFPWSRHYDHKCLCWKAGIEASTT